MKKRNRLVSLTIIIIIIIVTIMSLLSNTNRVKGAMTEPTKTYISIYINKNDTLWNVAEKYMNEDYYNYESYIEEVININNINNTTIYAGDTIIVPMIK